MENDFKTAISLLRQGQAPNNSEILRLITVGINDAVKFIEQKYLEEYLSLGGSKIKFLTGKPGSGKTHFLQFLSDTAKSRGFTVVNFSAKNTWLHDFKDIYAEIFKSSDIMVCLEKCAQKVIGELGYDSDSIPEGMTFADYLASKNELDAIIKKEMRGQVQNMFLKNPLIDNNFAIACGFLVGDILGHPTLESSNRDLLISWLSASKDVKLAPVRKLGLSPAKITKYNARHMLRSLSEVHRIASVPGIIVTIDDLDILVNSTSLDTIRYTRLKREDSYESIRELIDEIDTLRNIMFFFAFERKLIDDETSGLKSYQALWMRIQNEIVSSRFNMFTDIIDLDRFALQNYSKDILQDMSKRISGVLNMVDANTSSVTGDALDEILSKSQFSKTSLPRQVVWTTVGVREEIIL